jgi:hypothetical protein
MDDVENRKFLTQPRLELQPLDSPACSQSLYRLSYLGIIILIIMDNYDDDGDDNNDNALE